MCGKNNSGADRDRLDDTQVSFRDRDSRLSILQNDDDSYSLERSNESRMLLPDHDEVDDFQIEVLQDGSGGNKHGWFPHVMSMDNKLTLRR